MQEVLCHSQIPEIVALSNDILNSSFVCDVCWALVTQYEFKHGSKTNQNVQMLVFQVSVSQNASCVS
jgi:hypothetical protein